MPYTPSGYMMAGMNSLAPIAAPEVPPTAARPLAAQIDLAITGMTCAACSARIEKVLNRLPAVEAVVNFATERAQVSFDPSSMTIDRLIEAIRKAGYDAHEPVQAQQEEALAEASARKDRQHFIAAALLTAPLVAQMIPMLLGLHEWMLPNWVQLLLATPVQFWIGARFYAAPGMRCAVAAPTWMC